MNFIIIEDDLFKSEEIKRFLVDKYSHCFIDHAESVTSGMNLLKSNTKDSIVLLDMSLPTYDQSKGSDAGRPQGFGGIELMRFMEVIEDQRKIVVVTQFDTFTVDGECFSLKDLESDIVSEFPDNFLGIVQFDVVSDSWKQKLINIIGNKN